MDVDSITNALKSVDKDVLIFCCTTLIGFLSWLVKGLIEAPLITSKETFNRFMERRLEILVEIKTKLLFIAYFPDVDSSKEFKEDLQKIILRDGKLAYLSQVTYANTIKIAIEPETNEKLLMETIGYIEDDLSSQISKVQDEIGFYLRFSNFSPVKRTVSFFLLSTLYIVTITTCIFCLFILVQEILFGTLCSRILVVFSLIIIAISIKKWFRT